MRTLYTSLDTSLHSDLYLSIISSMTPEERRKQHIINGSRRKRIAKGSGTSVEEVNRLLKQFLQMQKVMKQFSKGGMRGLMRSLGGRMPPGFGP